MPLNLWMHFLFFNDDILGEVLIQTNQKIFQLQGKYKTENATTPPTSMAELKALQGLLIRSALLKDNQLTAEILFSDSFSRSR